MLALVPDSMTSGTVNSTCRICRLRTTITFSCKGVVTNSC